MCKAVEISENLRDMHADVGPSTKFVDAYEQAALTGSREERRMAKSMIRAFSGAGFVWTVLPSSIAANHGVAEAAGTMGFISRHQPSENPVAASPVRRIKLDL
jgi:hypothetical protein